MSGPFVDFGLFGFDPREGLGVLAARLLGGSPVIGHGCAMRGLFGAEQLPIGPRLVAPAVATLDKP
jgi:hypothetical protein